MQGSRPGAVRRINQGRRWNVGRRASGGRRSRGGGDGSGRAPDVAAMQATDLGNRDDPAEFRPLNSSAVGRILVKREVSTRPVVVPVTNLIRASEVGAPDTLVSTCGPSRGAPGRRRTKGCVRKTDGRRGETGRLSSLDWRSGQPLNPAPLRRRADSGDEVRRPAGSPRCTRPLAFVLRADGGCCCRGTDAGGWRCSTRGNCAAGVGGAVR